MNSRKYCPAIYRQQREISTTRRQNDVLHSSEKSSAVNPLEKVTKTFSFAQWILHDARGADVDWDHVGLGAFALLALALVEGLVWGAPYDLIDGLGEVRLHFGQILQSVADVGVPMVSTGRVVGERCIHPCAQIAQEGIVIAALFTVKVAEIIEGHKVFGLVHGPGELRYGLILFALRLEEHGVVVE